jgi:sigma-B regulation protein RsbU (phosphoserine phosphatase)
MVKDVVVAFSYRSRRPDTVLRQTNRLLVEKGIEGFVTLFLAILNPSTGVLIYSSAGHPNPLLWRSDGQIELLQVGSPPLGVFDSHPWRATEIQLEEQDILLAYTDGATEARRDGRLFGQEGLVDALRGRQGLSMNQLPEALLADILTFSNGVLSDDVALLALRLTGRDRAVKPGGLPVGGPRLSLREESRHPIA